MADPEEPMAVEEPMSEEGGAPAAENGTEEAPKETEKKPKRSRASAVATPASGKKGLYDASPVVEGKRERKKVERLEPATAPVKSPEATLKPVRCSARRGRRRAALCAGCSGWGLLACSCLWSSHACTARPRN